MNIAAYNMAQASYGATCDVLKTHLANCDVCHVAAPLREGGAFYCEVGRACFDEALRAQARLDQATRDALTGYCEHCD
jgi:hypothetical protein